jgi:hypothetical protein
MRLSVIRLSVIAGLAVGLGAASAGPLSAQRTRDRTRLVFTISGAYIGGVGLWGIPDQPITDRSAGPTGLTDHFILNRSTKNTVGGAFAGSYFRGKHLGITAEGLLLGLGYDDNCRLEQPVQSSLNDLRCRALDVQDRSAAAVAVSAGVIYRLSPDEFISPFGRVSAGLLVNNQSPILLVSEPGGSNGDLTVYDDAHKGTRLRPALAIGVGTTIAVGKAYQLRWEVRDNILGIQRVTGATAEAGEIPPHETAYKHHFSLLVGLDVVLERRPGRRY